MIHAFGHPDPPVPRLVATLAMRGHRVGAADPQDPEPATLVLGPGNRLDPMALAVLLDSWRRGRKPRVLVLSALGAHRDAKAERLRLLWELEELARASSMPVLTLRLAPIVGPESPLWLKLRTGPRLPNRGRQLLAPVFESDVVDTLERALAGQAKWEGWYEVAGPEIVSLAELAAMAQASGPRLRGEIGAWEPPPRELEEHRLPETDPWLSHFGISVRPLSARVAEWAA
jgi:hypothetical protein